MFKPNFHFLKKSSPKSRFDRKVLRKNDISLLMLDERYNSLFVNIEKTPEILQCEEKIKELLKEQSRLIAEQKEIQQCKKSCMDKIIQLTTEAFENNNEAAKNEMQDCQKEIQRINDRLVSLEQELDSVPDQIRETNLELLEHSVNVVYFKMRFNQKRVEELEKLIDEAHNRLKEYIDEKGALAQDYTDIYSYFHDLLGAEELEKMDKEFFAEE